MSQPRLITDDEQEDLQIQVWKLQGKVEELQNEIEHLKSDKLHKVVYEVAHTIGNVKNLSAIGARNKLRSLRNMALTTLGHHVPHYDGFGG